MNARRLKVWLGERVAVSDVGGSRVDRDAGVIFGVKVLGYESKNGRRYLPEAVKAAATLYEGASVRINHPRRAADQRDADDVFGWLEGVEVRADGLYADLHYLRSHPLATRLCEAAERNPELFGLSHNADGETETRGGETVVLEITEVRSVDLVADPATVGGLFEGRRMKLKAFFEAIKLPGKKQKAGRKLLSRLMEEGAMDPSLDAPMDAPPAEDAPPGDHIEALKQGFSAACHAVIDGEGDVKSKMAKLKEILTAADKLLASGEPVEESDDEEEVTEGEDEELEECEDDMKESVQLKRYKAREAVRELCESKNYQPSKAALAALVATPKAQRAALIEELRSGQKQTGRPRNQNVSESGRGSGGTGTTRDIKTGKDLASRLRDGSFSGN